MSVRELLVYVDKMPVLLKDVHPGDKVCTLACLLEEEKYDVNPGYPIVTKNGQEVDAFSRVDFNTQYSFCKLLVFKDRAVCHNLLL